MKVSLKKKWIKILLVPVILVVVLIAVASYFINNRFKEIIQLAVKEKSNSTYIFDARGISLSFLHKSITIKNAILYKKDTVNTITHYEVKIPTIYFRIASLKEIIFHQKVTVDSLSIINPSIAFHEHQVIISKQKTSQRVDIEALLHKLLSHLKVQSFDIKNASYIYKSKMHPSTLKVDNIDFTIKNFSNENTTKRLFSTDDIDLKIGKQHISLPDGVHFFDFKKLHFSGRNQYFELDSFTFLAKALPGRAETNVFADRIRFKSSRLSDIFTKDDLIIDTILLIKPILKLGKNNNQSKSTDNSKIKHLFKNINFKYIDIQDGRFANSDSLNKSPKYGTNKVDLKLYNFSYQPVNPKSLKADSVKLNLSKIKFLSKDGKVQLTVDEMAIAKNQVVLINAVYEPVHPSENSLSFSTPALKLKNVNFAALLNKQINAEQADLVNPMIKVLSKPKIIKAEDTSSVKGFKKLFKMLNNLKDLIAVRRFNIHDGTILVMAKAKTTTNIRVDKFNVNILADKFLNSDTTLELKHAIPLIKFSRLHVNSSKLKLLLNNYKFDGTKRHNWAGSIDLRLANGTRVQGQNFYWEWLDWDLYQNSKIIFIDSLKADYVNVSIEKNGAKSKVKKPLQKFQIGRLDVKQMAFNESGGKSNIHFLGNNIYGRNLESKENHVIWNKLGGNFNKISFSNEKLKLYVKSANLNATGDSRVEDIFFKTISEKDTNLVNLTTLKFKGPFKTTKLSSFNFSYLSLINPDLQLKSDSRKQALRKKPFSIPVDLSINKLEVEHAKIFQQTKKINSDTSLLSINFDLQATSLKAKKHEDLLFAAKSAGLSATKLTLSKPGLKVSTPLTLALENLEIDRVDEKLKVSTSIKLNILNGQLEHVKDSAQIKMLNIALKLDDKKFAFGQEIPLAWDKLLTKTTLEKAEISYLNKTSIINAKNLKWNPKQEQFKITDFDFKPKLSFEEEKIKRNQQTDYITGSAKTIIVNGIDLMKLKQNKSLIINGVEIDSAKLDVSRDKRMPDKNLTEKLMPSKLLTNLKSALTIDKLSLKNSEVNIHEISTATGLEGVIPLKNINVSVYKLTNKFSKSDSLQVKGDVMLLDKDKISLNYRESYADSLSGFKMNMLINPINLSDLTQITKPLAAVRINSGITETITASWIGNRYLADGVMLLPYKQLNISLLDKKNPERKSFVLFAENKLVNLILHHQNSKPSFMFFERNRNKFVFNYWIKTILSGFASSVGLKKEHKLKKQDNTARLKYNLTLEN